MIEQGMMQQLQSSPHKHGFVTGGLGRFRFPGFVASPLVPVLWPELELTALDVLADVDVLVGAPVTC